jgi:magnesium chelatase subunit I
MMNLSDKQYVELLKNIPQLENVVKKFQPSMNGNSKLLLMEFLLFGLSEYSLLSRTKIEDGIQFRDMLSSMFTMPNEEDFEDEDDSSEYKF